MSKSFEYALMVNAMMSGNLAVATVTASKGVKQLNEEASRLAQKQSALQQRIQATANNVIQQRVMLASLEQAYRQGTLTLSTYGRAHERVSKELYKNEQELQNLRDALNQANKAQRELSGQIPAAKMGEAFNNISIQAQKLVNSFYMIKMAATPFVGVVETAANFEAAMSKVGAISRASESDMKKLTATAKELGATTQYSATQAADAMSYLGMAGWDSQQIIKGMPGLLALAAAGGMDLARAADIVSDDLTAFGLKAEDAAHLSDVFATVITRTNTNVEMLGETMKYAAPVATAFGARLEETSAMAGMMANAGIKASQAGTSLRAGLLRLAGPPKKAASELAALGISMSDVAKEQQETADALEKFDIKVKEIPDNGNKLAVIIEKIATATKDMGKEEKLAALQAIFGTTAASGWLAVIDQGPEKLRELTAQLQNCDGASEELAKKMQNNAKGALIQLQSAMESLSISIGSAVLPGIAEYAKAMANATGEMAAWMEQHPAAAELIILVTGSLAGLVLAYKASMMASAMYNALMVSGGTLMTAYNLAIGLVTGKLTLMAAAQKIAAGAQWLLNIAMSANPIGAVAVAIFAISGALKLFYDNCLGARQAWNRFFRNVEVTCPLLAKWIEYMGFVLFGPYRILCAIVDKVKDLMGMKPELTVQEKFDRQGFDSNPGPEDIPHNARGGIYNKGAFLTTFAEEGPEAAIPLDGSPRAVGLWRRAGELLGQRSGGGEYNISIPITVNGGADAGTVQNIAGQVEEAVRRALADIQHQNRRLSYA